MLTNFSSKLLHVIVKSSDCIYLFIRNINEIALLLKDYL